MDTAETYDAAWYLVGGAGDVYAATMCLLGGLGLVLCAARTPGGWRLQVAVLLGLTAMWATAVAGFLADDSIGHECTTADHGGEWPSLLVTIAWAGALGAALARPDPPVAQLAVRIGLPVLTIGLIGGTVWLMLSLQVDGC